MIWAWKGLERFFFCGFSRDCVAWGPLCRIRVFNEPVGFLWTTLLLGIDSKWWRSEINIVVAGKNRIRSDAATCSNNSLSPSFCNGSFHWKRIKVLKLAVNPFVHMELVRISNLPLIPVDVNISNLLFHSCSIASRGRRTFYASPKQDRRNFSHQSPFSPACNNAPNPISMINTRSMPLLSPPTP